MQQPDSHQSLRLVAVAIVSGLVAAAHMGKIPAALPNMSQDLGLSLSQSGLVVSVFSLLAAVAGLAIGVLSSHLGRIRAGIAGLTLVGVGSYLGSVSDSFQALLLSRLIEGLGFVLIAITMPGLINAVCPPRHRAMAMGIWGAFIPTAMCLMLLTTPTLIELKNWQGVWLITCIVSVVWLIIFTLSFRSMEMIDQGNRTGLSSLRLLFLPTPLLVVGIFVCYSALFAAVTAFLPTFWKEELNLDINSAAYLSALVVSGNIAGNVIAGWLTARGIKMKNLFVLAFLVGGIAAVLVFQLQNSVSATLFAAFIFTLFSGFIPGGVFANLSDLMPQQKVIPLMVGLIFQGAGIGQVIGPLLLTASVDYQGNWIDAGYAVGLLASTGLLLTSLLAVSRSHH